MAADPWLVVIDMQRIFETDQQWGVPQYWDAAERIARLLPRFTGRTVYTRFVAPEVPALAWRDYYEMYPGALLPDDHPTWDITPVVAQADAPVVSVTTMNKWGAELEAIVGEAPLVLVGVSTDCCVIATGLAAADAGRHVAVVEDACRGVNATSHDSAIGVLAMFQPMVTVTTTDAILAGGGA